MATAHGNADVMDNLSGSEELPAAHKTACLQCRHQKIKCKPSPDGSIICARCQKMRLPCIYQGRRERTSKTTKDKEIQEPPHKRRLIANDNSNATSPSTSSFPAVHASPYTGSTMSDASPVSSSNNLSPSSGYHDGQQATTIWSLHRKGSGPTQTQPRRLDKVHVDAVVIDNLFTTFFLNYSVDVPILDPLMSPNDYYNRSPLLFWSIMTVASRRYAADPTLLVPLSAATFKLANTQADGPSADIHTVESLLLLLSWHFPSNPTHEEAGYVLSGAMIHLAFKLGLHIAEAGQDYVRVRLNLDETEIKRRRYLWATCVIVYQEVGSMLGNTCLQVPAPLISKEIPRIKSSDPKLRLQLQAVLSRAHSAFADNGTDVATPGEERTLQLLVRTYEDEIKMMESSVEVLTARERLYIAYATMQIQCMHFFRPAENLESSTLAKVYSSTVRVIELLSELDNELQFAQYATSYIMRSIPLAACVLVRLIKTPHGEAIDMEEAKSFFLMALQLIQKMTVAVNDGPARCANALGRLWRSDRIFKNADGTFHQRLRVRSRYGPSVLWDTMAWCREEFGTQQHLYSSKSSIEQQPTLPAASTVATSSVPAAMEPDLQAIQTGPLPMVPMPAIDQNAIAAAAVPPGPVNAQIPLSFDWSMEDWFFPPDMSLAGEWSVPTNMMEGYSIDPEVQNPFLSSGVSTVA